MPAYLGCPEKRPLNGCSSISSGFSGEPILASCPLDLFSLFIPERNLEKVGRCFFQAGCTSFSLNIFCYQAASVRRFIWKVGLETEVMVI